MSDRIDLAWPGANLLTDQQSSFEDSALGTTGWSVDSNCTLARSTAQADDGSASMSMTAASAGTMVARTSSIRCVPTQTYSARARLRANTTARTCRVGLRFLTSVGAVISTNYGTGAADNNAGWTTITRAAMQAPSNAAFVQVFVEVQSPANAEVHYVDGVMCNVGAVPSAFQLGVADVFAAWEIQRSEAGGAYAQIADITDLLAVSWSDYESRRGVAATYRVRMRMTDGSLSSFATSNAATAEANFCYLAFVSNEDPTLNLEVNDQAPRMYQFLENRTLLQLFDRDYQVAFAETEDRGDAFDVELALYGKGGNTSTGGLGETPTPGRASFNALLAIARAQLSYVCVLNSNGDRWFATLSVLAGTRLEPGATYLAQVRITQVTATPSTPDFVVT